MKTLTILCNVFCVLGMICGALLLYTDMYLHGVGQLTVGSVVLYLNNKD